MASPVHPDTNLNDLDVSIFLKLVEILGINATWKKLNAVLPMPYSCTVYHIQSFEQAVFRQIEPAEAFLRDIGNKGMTSGELIPCLEMLELEPALLLIKEFEPVKIIRDLPTFMEVPFGFNNHFKLECIATGFPRPLFQWLKMSNSETWEELLGQNSHILDIKPVRYEDKGVYICCVQNRNPHCAAQRSTIFTKKFTLQVVFDPTNGLHDPYPLQIPPPFIILHPSLPTYAAVVMGSSLTFECFAKGVMPISYQWFKNGHIITPGTSMYTNEALEERSVLKIENIQPENDESRFTIQCKVTNPGGVTMSKELKFTLLTGPSAQFMAEDKVALLIGNGIYSKHPELPNVKNDIVALAKELTAMDFKVLTLVDLEKKEMYNAVDEFCKLLDTNVYGLFYYAGHGFQSHRRCYMVPVTSQEQCSLQECICLDNIEERMQLKNPALCYLILDMCRNDIVCSEQDINAPRPGLVRRNRIYSYATTNSCSALDGRAGGNGLFMKHLLKSIRLRKPLKEVLDKVVEDIGVDRLASNMQIPEISSTLSRRLSLMDSIRPIDIHGSKERTTYYKYLKNPPIPNYGVQYGNVHINIEVEPHEQVLDNELEVKLSVNRAGLDENCSAYIEKITTLENEKIDVVRLPSTPDQEQYARFLISDMQKIKGQLFIDVVLFRYDPYLSELVTVPIGLPLISRACLWRQSVEDPHEVDFLSGSSHVSH